MVFGIDDDFFHGIKIVELWCGFSKSGFGIFVETMRIHSLLTIGDFHTNQCEDFLISEELGSHQQLIAVMDGCTMGKESVFASLLIGKILRKIAKEKFYRAFAEKQPTALGDQLKEIVRELFQELKTIKNQLGLETNELLSTLLIGVVHSENAKAEFLTVGDGLIYCDGKKYEYDQNDKPDYLGYHLNENFEEWYNAQKQKLSIPSFQNLSICTDGIFSFKNFERKAEQKSENEIIEFFLSDGHGNSAEKFLGEKLRVMKETWNHVVTDDLAIIRMINIK